MTDQQTSAVSRLVDRAPTITGAEIAAELVPPRQFETATFQHRWLGRAGTPEDTTVVYLVIQGRPEGAFIAEPVTVLPKTARRTKK